MKEQEKEVTEVAESPVAVTEIELGLVAKKASDSEVIANMKEKYKSMAKDMPHREYGMALDSLAKALGVIQDWLKNIADVEADIAEKKNKAKK